MDTNSQMHTPRNATGSMGFIIAVVIIIALLVLGSLYYSKNFGGGTGETPATTLQDLQNLNDPDVQAMLQQGSSDDLASIQADVDATNLGAIDAAVADVNASLPR